jgi:phage shock protein A
MSRQILAAALLILHASVSYGFIHHPGRLLQTHSSIATSTTNLYVFDRLVRLVSSNVNGLMKKLEDPEKIIEQAVDDMQNDLIKVRQSYAQVSATQKRMEKQRETALATSEDWYRRAQLALQKGDEELAREALARRQSQKDVADGLTKQINIQEQAIDKLYSSMMALEVKITEAKRQKEALIARARTAKTSLQVNDMLSSLTTSSSMEAFTRMQDKVDALESQAEIAGEMAGVTSSSMEERFAALEGSTAVDRELEQMRKQLPGSTKPIAELPRSISSTNLQLDEEYEKLKREMKGRA